MTIRTLIVAAIASLCITGTGLGQIVADFFPGQKLTASDGVEGDQLGYSVAIDGNTAVFGAWGTSSDAGSAYTFNRDESGNWSQGQELIAWDEEAMDMFGMSVAISGDTIVIGTPLDNQNGPSSGSVYVFERDGSGTWSETAKLTLTNGEAGDNFGHCVSVSDDTLLVGAFGTDGATGSAWIINRNPLGYWTEGQQLTASNGTSGDVFGNSVAISHDTCMVGAFGTGAHAGSVYVFTSDASGIWSQAAELTATGGASGDYFGSSVDIDGDTCVIGALGTDDQTGMVCVFMFDANDMWSQVAELSATDGADGDSFGYSVAIDGNSCVIGTDG
ncbi:MAG: FG-GAP repeat protein, partial [SAR202 cluster bacterium]|nr:FG-GAP repeat protein [SAR202 cluster bacterium]